jgi:hypothetical protein
MQLVNVDVDGPKHAAGDAWFEAITPAVRAILAAHPGMFWARSRGGFRFYARLDRIFLIRNARDADEWSGRYEALLDAWDEIANAHGGWHGGNIDRSSTQWNRLQRIPHDVRDGVLQRLDSKGNAHAVGTVALPPPKRPIKDVVIENVCTDSRAAAAFGAAGLVTGEQSNGVIVKCPWANEHSNGDESGTVIFHNDGERLGAGKFYCAHSHCKGRHTSEALKTIEGWPAVKVELAHWTDGMGGWKRSDEPSSTSDVQAPTEAPAADFTPTPRPARKLHLVSARELSAPLPPVDWVCKRLGLPLGGRPSLFVGKAGAAKTTAAQDLAVSVASGTPLFGAPGFEVRQGSVLHIDVDQGQMATMRRYQQISAGRRLDLSSLPLDCVFFGFALTRGEAIDTEAVQLLTDACMGRTLVIIDSLRGLAPGLDENSSAFGIVLQTLSSVSDAVQASSGAPVTFLVVHHSGKGESTVAGRGTSAIQDRAGSLWTLERPEGALEVKWSHHKASEMALGCRNDFATELVIATPGLNQEDAPAITVKVHEGSARQSKDAPPSLEERRAIAKALAQHPEGLSVNTLEARVLGVGDKRLRYVVGVMIPDGELHQAGKGSASRVKLSPGAGTALLQK